jgi:hypothetical protein
LKSAKVEQFLLALKKQIEQVANAAVKKCKLNLKGKRCS